MLEKVKELVNEIEVRTKALQELIQAEANNIFQALFEKWPDLKNFGWIQYTPYFNDGDPCVFGISLTFVNAEVDEDGYIDDPYEYEIYESKHSDRKLEGCKADVWFTLLAIPDDIKEKVWGDHKKIVVTREGVNVQHYDHE